MKKIKKILILALLMVSSISIAEIPKYYSEAYAYTTYLLENKAYDIKPKNVELSRKVFDKLLENCDSLKMILTEGDVNSLNDIRDKYLSLSSETKLEIGLKIYDRCLDFKISKYEGLINILKNSSEKDISEILNTNREYWIDRENIKRPKDDKEISNLWLDMLANAYIRLKVNGYKDAEIRKILIRRYEDNIKYFKKISYEDKVSAVINSYTDVIDPHDTWYNKSQAEDFRIDMSLSLTGIGVQTSRKVYGNVVRKVYKDTPAGRIHMIKSGDMFVAVAQGDKGKFEDVSDATLTELSHKLRGPKGTIVRVKLKDVDTGKIKTVRIVRGQIYSDDERVRAKMYKLGEDKVGYIVIPSFYSSVFSRKDGSDVNVSTDVAKEIEKFKENNVDAMVIDLRNNGGGSLYEVKKLLAEFIGPNQVAVQVRSSNGVVTQLKTPSDSKMIWTKPLVIMINRYSASASEIFAGAIKDYNRGILVGNNTWGKGSVQTVSEFDQVFNVKHDDNLGLIKYTVQMFFRPKGSSTQLKGVKPDISFPNSTILSDTGEQKYKNHLEWRSVPSANIKEFKPTYTLDYLIRRHEARAKQFKSWNELIKEKEFAKKELKYKKVLINLNERQKKHDMLVKTRDEFIGFRKKYEFPTVNVFEVDNGLDTDEEDVRKDVKKEEELRKILDMQAIEAMRIAVDMLK